MLNYFKQTSVSEEVLESTTPPPHGTQNLQSSSSNPPTYRDKTGIVLSPTISPQQEIITSRTTPGRFDSIRPDSRIKNREVISISRLSTICLGADVKVHEEMVKLENSCTYHVFPTDEVLDVAPVVLKSSKNAIWHPGVSSPDRKKEFLPKEIIIHAPFKGFFRAVARTDTPQRKERKTSSPVKLAMKRSDVNTHSKVDFPVIKNGMLITSDINLGEQVKFKSRRQSAHSSDGIGRFSSGSVDSNSGKLFTSKNVRGRFGRFIKGKKRPMTTDVSKQKDDSSEVKSEHRVKLPNESFKIERLGQGLNLLKEEDSDVRETIPPVEDVVVDRSRELLSKEESMKKVADYILNECATPSNQNTPREVSKGLHKDHHHHGNKLALNDCHDNRDCHSNSSSQELSLYDIYALITRLPFWMKLISQDCWSLN